MKTYHFILAIFIMLPAYLFAQKTEEAKTLVKQGVALHDSAKYEQAMAKYSEAIKADPNYSSAYYEMGFTLFTTGKEKESIPYLDKVLSLDPKSAEAYDMLGSVYDDLHQADKAIDYFRKGIDIDSTYQRLHFNLAITCYGVGKYAESENEAMKAIRLDATHASSHRVFAMAAYKLKQRGISLLAWSNFLMLEPQSKRSPEAVAYLRSILQYGIKWTGEKSVNISVDKDDAPSNMLMQLSVTNALEKKTNMSTIDSMRYQLGSLFEIANSITGEKAPLMVKHYYADYLEKLTKSGNMEAFTRFVTLSVYKDENLAWFKLHDDQLKAFAGWMQSTTRNF